MNTLVCEHADHKYVDGDGTVLEREYGKTPNGNDMRGRWVLRNPKGDMIDFDQYRNDIVERNDIKLGCAK